MNASQIWQETGKLSLGTQSLDRWKVKAEQRDWKQPDALSPIIRLQTNLSWHPYNPPQHLCLFQSILKEVNISAAVACWVLHHVHLAVSYRTPNCYVLELSWAAPSSDPQLYWWCTKICLSLENLGWKPLPYNRQDLWQSWRYCCTMSLSNVKGQTRLAYVTMICLRSETETSPHGNVAVAVLLHTQNSDSTKHT